MVEKWKKLDSRKLADYRIFELHSSTNRSPKSGDPHEFYVIRSVDWINVVPITPQGQVVLIHQYRHGIDEVTLEIPGGMVDADDPSPATSARRELLEETGYDSEDVVQLGSISPNPAIFDNACHLFLARNVEKVAEQRLDGTEDITVGKATAGNQAFKFI